MNIENMEAFVYVNHYGSFNKAAEALFLSQPSVTARIQTLERELECKLFDRQSKQTVLTEDGRKFLPYAEQMLQVLQKGKQKLQQRKKAPQQIRIGCTISVSNYIIPEILKQLRARYPEVNYKIVTATTDQLVHKLLNREVDISFVRKVMHPAIRTLAFYEDPISLYVYDGHPFMKTGKASIQDIQRETLVFFECGSLDWMRIHRAFESLEQPPDIAFQVDNVVTAKKLVLEEAGIAFLPDVCVNREVKDQILFRIHVPEVAGVSMQISIIATKEDCAVTSDFADALTEGFRGAVLL
ncbi:LysR family transcriptional regulator [Paenibacillus polymyxa]|uniref:LysR family transcriptional regulator n=1 Tax=Paenibacillus polymyxa TaxID=1406 RepID=UPI0023782DDE|nr:LysR family transcriptional regulator [Paenibacillus polymyxa]WDM24029.1 LysR family transcriptional regulator [Paenibacillus polymyxa]